MSSAEDPVWKLLFGPNPDLDDVNRWRSQKFVFSSEFPFVLEQTQGGPCGVLAPVQGFLIASLMRECLDMDALKRIDCVRVKACLKSVLEQILERASVHRSPEHRPFHAVSLEEGRFVPCDHSLESLSVLDFLSSLVVTRGVANVLLDMDDPTTPLIGRFGHCSQEVLNLVLFGKATSNVFDGSLQLDEYSSLQGVPETADVRVGLLSELEALRYVRVGEILKNPTEPIWVLGSPSHYTLLFGFAKIQNSVVNLAKQAFSKFALDEGLALSSALEPMLTELEIPPSLDTCGIVSEGVVLLHDFLGWVRMHRPNLAPEDHQQVETHDLVFVDGQAPVRVFRVQLGPTPLESEEQATADLLRPVMRTKWPSAYVTVNSQLPASGQLRLL